ncbi:MAG: Mov34/MPN/PAD-1 family protein [Fusobacteriaceae bacterium]
MNEVININEKLLKKFILEVQNKYPMKSFGYFICGLEKNDPEDYIIIKNDVRENMEKEFEEYGKYYIRNKDARFLSGEMETIEIHKKLLKEKKKIIGVFHSHQRHPAIFSTVDLELHTSDHI